MDVNIQIYHKLFQIINRLGLCKTIPLSTHAYTEWLQQAIADGQWWRPMVITQMYEDWQLRRLMTNEERLAADHLPEKEKVSSCRAGNPFSA